MKSLLEFDDAGAGDDHPARGVTIGDIRAWHDQYDAILASWAECRQLLTEERLESAKLREDYARLDANFAAHLKLCWR